MKLAAELKGHEGPVNQVRFSKDYKYVISASQDCSIRIWSVSNKKELTKINAHIDSANTFVTNGSDNLLFSGGSDGNVCWWDIEQNVELHRTKCHTGPVQSVCFNYNYSVSISGSFDSAVKVFDNKTSFKYPVMTLLESKDAITSVQSGSYEIFTASVDGIIRIYDVRNCKLVTDKLAESVVDMELSGDDQTLLLATKQNEIKLVTKHTGETIQTYSGHVCSDFFIKCKYAANHNAVISGSEDGDVFVWDLVKGTVAQRFNYNNSQILDVAGNEPFTTLVAANADGNIGMFVLE